MKVRIKIIKTDYLYFEGVTLPVEVEATYDNCSGYRVSSDELERIGVDLFAGRDGGLLLLDHPDYDKIEVVGECKEGEFIYVHTYQHASGLNQKTRVTVYEDAVEAEAQCILLGGTVKKYAEVKCENQGC